MRVHLELDDALVAQIDQRSGARNRRRFIRDAIAAALDERQNQVAGPRDVVRDRAG